jgi:hypothetical protein
MCVGEAGQGSAGERYDLGLAPGGFPRSGPDGEDAPIWAGSDLRHTAREQSGAAAQGPTAGG